MPLNYAPSHEERILDLFDKAVAAARRAGIARALNDFERLADANVKSKEAKWLQDEIKRRAERLREEAGL